jgi:hypothetical protein
VEIDFSGIKKRPYSPYSFVILLDPPLGIRARGLIVGEPQPGEGGTLSLYKVRVWVLPGFRGHNEPAIEELYIPQFDLCTLTDESNRYINVFDLGLIRNQPDVIGLEVLRSVGAFVCANIGGEVLIDRYSTFNRVAMADQN